jgi:hypothetical protein
MDISRHTHPLLELPNSVPQKSVIPDRKSGHEVHGYAQNLPADISTFWADGGRDIIVECIASASL